jgi:hypothetical protein
MQRVCQVCGRSFERSGRGQPARVCSAECRRARHARESRASRRSQTNEDTGARIVVDASGPGEFVTHADGSQDITFLGNSVLVVPPDGTLSLASVPGRTQGLFQQLS